MEDLYMKKEKISTNSLAHTKWNCKYHIVFAPKYRRKVFFEEKRLEIREILDNYANEGVKLKQNVQIIFIC